MWQSLYELLFFILCIGGSSLKSIPDTVGQEKVFFSFSHTNMLRGIAILLILLQHSAGEWGTRIFTPCGGTVVVIFLFLSGYGLNESYKKNGLNGFWLRKLSRVLIPYAIFGAVCMLVLSKEFAFKFYLLDVLGIASCYWYVSFLLKLYILFYILTRWFAKCRVVLFLLISVFAMLFLPML